MTHARATFAAAALAGLLSSGLAGATAQRTFVASYGVTANAAVNCSIAQPCRQFTEAHGVTASGGEIVVLDSAGYGRVTITKSLSIIAPPGVHAGISVFAGTNGVDIPTGGITVILRGLSITGQGGTHGIYVTGDNKLTIERCDVGGMNGNGIFLDSVSGTAQIRDTVVHDGAQYGLFFAGPLSATLERVSSERNLLAGMAAYDGGAISLRNSAFIRNDQGIEVGNSSAGVTTRVHGDGLQLTRNNQHGLSATASNGDVGVSLTRSTVDLNPAGGAQILVTGANGKARGSFIENTFAGNGPSSIYLDRGPGILPNSAQVNIARNAFADAFVNAKGPGGGQFLTDQHNTEDPDSLVAPMDGNRLF